MYDIKPLEETWKQYHKNKRKPYFLGALGLSILFIVGGVFFNAKNVSLPQLSMNSTGKFIKTTQMNESNVLLDGALSQIQLRKIDKIEQIKPVVKMHIDTNIEETMPTLPLVNDIPILDKEPIKKKQIHTKAKMKIISEKPRKKMHLNIIESSSVSAYKDVERRFIESHDTDDSLFLAKSYYRKGNYKKSEFWSLQTNKVNSHIEESWMIFAQSKIKLGHINEAIQVLKSYVKHSNSQKAKELLYRLRKN